MSAQTRLTTALQEGTLQLPEGDILVMRPPMGYDISVLPRDRVTVLHTFKLDATYWEQCGLPVQKTAENAQMAIVVVPRAKALAKAMIAQACAQAEVVVVDGAKTDGVDSLYKACRKVLGEVSAITKDHGRLFWFATTNAFQDWDAPAPTKGAHGFVTTAGVFSDGAVDKGSAFLASVLPDVLPARLADFGAGWGYLSVQALGKSGVASVDLIEAEALSLDCAMQNVDDPRATYLWDDVTQNVATTPYDGIIMNPPFHVGRSGDPDLGRAFIRAAARSLTPKGQLWMVANRHLPYEMTLAECFQAVQNIAQNSAFKVFHAQRPKR